SVGRLAAIHARRVGGCRIERASVLAAGVALRRAAVTRDLGVHPTVVPRLDPASTRPEKQRRDCGAQASSIHHILHMQEAATISPPAERVSGGAARKLGL